MLISILQLIRLQVFPDEVHLDTLHTYLKACAELHPDVKVHVILVALVERLAAYGQRQQALGQPPIPAHIPLFDIFSDQIGNIDQVCHLLTDQARLFLDALLIGTARDAIRTPRFPASITNQPRLPLLSRPN